MANSGFTITLALLLTSAWLTHAQMTCPPSSS